MYDCFHLKNLVMALWFQTGSWYDYKFSVSSFSCNITMYISIFNEQYF